MANNRLYLINRKLGIKVYLARYGAGAAFFDPIPGVEDTLRLAFSEDEYGDWNDHGWELADERSLPDGLKFPEDWP